MKHFLVLLLAFSLFTACKDNKKPTGRDDRGNTDDYGKNDDNRDDNKGDDDSNNSDFKTASWSSSDIREFNQKCADELEKNGAGSISDKFCPCLLEKASKKYGSMAEMDRMGTGAEGEAMARECNQELGLDKSNPKEDTDFDNAGGSWTSAQVNAFVTNCVAEAVRGGAMTRSKATSYCSCMQEKFERMFPNPADAAGVTDADMESPSMKRLIEGCLQ